MRLIWIFTAIKFYQSIEPLITNIVVIMQLINATSLWPHIKNTCYITFAGISVDRWGLKSTTCLQTNTANVKSRTKLIFILKLFDARPISTIIATSNFDEWRWVFWAYIKLLFEISSSTTKCLVRKNIKMLNQFFTVSSIERVN